MKRVRFDRFGCGRRIGALLAFFMSLVLVLYAGFGGFGGFCVYFLVAFVTLVAFGRC